MEAEVVAALVTAAAALGVALYQARTGHDSQVKLAELQLRLDEMGTRNDARIAYEFDARKELYKNVEPLLFQLHEAAQRAFSRAGTLARDAHNDDLKEGGWLRGPGYYMRSTIHTLLVPVAIAKLLSSRVTFVDVGLDESVARRYVIARTLGLVFSEDHNIAAEFTPKLKYDPNHKEAAARSATEPTVYIRQGLPSGLLDRTAEALLDDSNESPRVLSYGEFEARFIADATFAADFQEFVDLFTNFHPARRPILWRLIVTQAFLCELFIRERSGTSAWMNPSKFDLLGSAGTKLDWRQPSDKETEQRVLEPLQVAKAYAGSRLPWLVSSPEAKPDLQLPPALRAGTLAP